MTAPTASVNQEQQQLEEAVPPPPPAEPSTLVTVRGSSVTAEVEVLDGLSVESSSSSSSSELETATSPANNNSQRPPLQKSGMSRSSPNKSTSSSAHNSLSGLNSPSSSLHQQQSSQHNKSSSTSETSSQHQQQHRPTLLDMEASNAVGNHSKRFQYDEKLTLGKSMAVSEMRESHKNMTIEEQEIHVREKDQSNLIESIHSVFSSLKVIFVFLLTKETYITMLLAVLSTAYFYFMHRDEDDWEGGGIPFVLLGVAVVIPTINLITMEYTRRESALKFLGELRGVWLRIYMLHCYMDWDGGKGRRTLGPNGDEPMGGLLDHSDKVGDNILGACDELMRFLTLPSSTNTHNYLTTMGRTRATEILSVGEPLFESCTARRGARFTALAEELKAAGASQTEMSRMEQFQRDMQSKYEQLRYLKMYRTPQALRSLARVTTIMMLPLFGPSYAQLAMNIGSLFFGLMLTAVSALILSGLYEAARVVEDPFNAFVVMDGINVREEMEYLYRQIVAVREEAFKEEARANPYEVPPSRCMTASTLYSYFDDEAEEFGERVGTTFREDGVDANPVPTMDTILDATPSRKNRRKRFGR